MKTQDSLQFTKGIVTALLFAMLMMNTLHSGAALMDAKQLARHGGTGFWSDPCTWDGFVVGASAILCPTTIGACVTGVSALYKAIKVDNCFG